MCLVSHRSGPEVSAQDLTEDEEAEAVDEDVVDDVTAEDEDDEAEVEDDENAELVSDVSKNTNNTNITHQYNCTLWYLLLCSLIKHVSCELTTSCLLFLLVLFLISNHMLSVWCETWN